MWIILITDRARLGGPVAAVSRFGKARLGRTYLPDRMRLFSTQRQARAFLRDRRPEGGRWLFTIARA